MTSIQVVIAALNEQEGIGPTISELLAYLNKPIVLVVDGRSSDRTVQIAQSLGAHIFLQDGKGKGDAVAKAIKHIDSTSDYVVITDADYTYPAEYIPTMIKILEANPEIGMVCGNRFNGYTDLKGLGSIFYFGNRLIAFTHNIFNGVPLSDPLTGLRVVRTNILKKWNVKSRGFDIEVELNHFVEQQGFKITEVPIMYRARLGEKKLGLSNGAEIFRRIMLESLY